MDLSEVRQCVRTLRERVSLLFGAGVRDGHDTTRRHEQHRSVSVVWRSQRAATEDGMPRRMAFDCLTRRQRRRRSDD